jgi:hypothetical protein
MLNIVNVDLTKIEQNNRVLKIQVRVKAIIEMLLDKLVNPQLKSNR